MQKPRNAPKKVKTNKLLITDDLEVSKTILALII